MNLKSIFLSIFFLCAVVNADTTWIGAGGNFFFENASNWNNGIPGETDFQVARINQTSQSVTYNSGTRTTFALNLGDSGSGDCELTFTGGELTLNSWFVLGFGESTNAILNMFGGRINSRNVDGAGDLAVGAHLGGDGIINIHEGVIEAWQLLVGYFSGNGIINIYGGTIDLPNSGEALFITERGEINIAGGEIIQAGNHLEFYRSLIDTGRIVAYNGSGNLYVDFDEINPGKTTIKASTNAAPTYCNPLEVKAADVTILHDNGTYYLYATASEIYPANVKGNPIWSSKDLVNWQYRGHTFNQTTPTWGNGDFWGAECLKKNNKYYLFYGAFKTIGSENTARICVAQADSPIGPFTEIAAPLFNWGTYDDVIDAGSFVDDDGEVYLFFTTTDEIGNCIYSAKVASNMLSLATIPQLCIYPTQSWENAPSPYVEKVTEGAFVVKHEGIYYLMYSGSDFRYEYAIGYATSSSPLGPWTKYAANPILSSSGNIECPGSHCVVSSPDASELFIVYHSHLEPDGYVRQLNIDRMNFTDNASDPDIIVINATTTAQPYPNGSHFIKTATDDEFNSTTLDTNIWTNIWGQTQENFPLDSGKLSITLESGCAWQNRADGSNLFLQNAPDGNWEASTKVTFDAQQNFEGAFLTLWQDSDNYVIVNTNYADGKKFEVAKEINGIYSTIAMPTNYMGNTVHLKIERISPNIYRFYSSANGTNWYKIGTDTYLPFVDEKIGIGAWLVDSSRVGVVAEFEHFHIEREFKPADINADNSVDLSDYATVASQWQNYSPYIHDISDINEDGHTDMADIVQIANYWLEN